MIPVKHLQKSQKEQREPHYFLKHDSSHVAVAVTPKIKELEREGKDYEQTNLGADLVATLTSLQMNNFPHLALDQYLLLPYPSKLTLD